MNSLERSLAGIARDLDELGRPGHWSERWRSLPTPRRARHSTLLAGAGATELDRARTAIAKLEAIDASPPGLLAKRLEELDTR